MRTHSLKSSSTTKTILFALLITFSIYSFAQDLEPRRWTNTPIGINIAGLGYGYTDGDIFLIPVLKVEDGQVNINALAGKYIHSFKFLKKLARVDVLLPFAAIEWDGLLSGIDTVINRTGFADARIRLSLNIIGPGALSRKDLLEYYKNNPVNTTVGISFSTRFPVGQYYNDKLLNIGQNVFVFRPQLGIVYNYYKWEFEASSSILFYSKNNEFYGNNKRERTPVYAVQTHLIRRLHKGIWASLSAGYANGGESFVNDISNDDNQEILLLSMAFGIPVTKKQIVKVVYNRSSSLVEIGANLDTFTIGWAVIF